ncbi:MAG: hypothetical protein U0P45_03115 [Acidimicrobiales bacterium]
MAASTDAAAERRAAVRAAIVGGDVDSLRALGTRLRDEGHPVTPDELRADLKELGAVKVESPDGPRYAIPVEEPSTEPPAAVAALVADPDWPIQVAVAAVVVVFVLVALVGWLIAL